MTNNRKRPTLVSLFAGAGGLDIGLELAGFQTVTAVDNDSDCVATLRANQARGVPCCGGRRLLGGTKIIQADVETLEPRQLRPAGRRGAWVPDLLAGGPPCQPFSSAGKMLSVNDERGRLFEHFVRIAAAVRPRFILFENVRGLVTARGPSGESGEVLFLVQTAFEEIGYATRFGLLNAADFGCPQRRARLFMLAARCSPLPVFPEPTHAERPETGFFETKSPWATLEQFLRAHEAPVDDDIVRPSPNLAALLRDVPEGTGLKSPGARETTRPGGHWGYKQGTFIANPKKPARTVTAAATQDWIRLPDKTLRRLTVRECASLQGFPPEWQFVGTQAGRFRQVGNAVPTIFGRILGSQILAALDAIRARKRPGSAPLPRSFVKAITYTKKEQKRNGESRLRVRMLQATGGQPVHELKGVGRAEFRASSTR